jgi:radical SAM protein with 4Fe4S-binding SPASM domain
MTAAFAERLISEYGELARSELSAIRSGRAPVAGCFIEPVLSLEMGRQRLSPCGAGARYVSVDYDGRIFLCHRFAGDARCAVGDVDAGLDRRALGALLHSFAERSASCRDCWAFGLCGGPCMYDVDCSEREFAGPGEARCRVTRRVLELSMWLYASLPAESREHLSRAARELGRPEMAEPGAGTTRRARSGSVDVPERKGVNSEEGR